MIIRLPTNCETQGGKKRARPHWPRPLFYIVHSSFYIVNAEPANRAGSGH